MADVERGRIPYISKSPRGEKVLIIAPHPDDEVIGCGGLIALLRREKRSVQTIVVTDGAAADPEQSSAAYRESREQECVAGLAVVGADAPRFLQLPDRSLSHSDPSLRDAIARILNEVRPDLLLVPSPVEIHPDHEAVSRVVCELIQSEPSLRASMPVCRILFYEVSQPIRPNLLVDITAVAEEKFRAVATHQSQTRLRDYERFARGLNEYRALSLEPDVRYAEAYWEISASELRVTPWSRLRESVSGSATVSVVSETVPITVIVRTKNRPHWLKEALESIAAGEHPSQLVIVNDGGSSVQEIARHHPRASLIEHEQSKGRSEAMNSGVASATTPFLAFLDDDDLFYPEHLSTLAAASRVESFVAYYTDAVSTYHSIDESGQYARVSSMRSYGQDYDRDMLRFDNYIPLTTLLLRRNDYQSLGGFDPSFDLFEDWDFLLRLAEKGAFLRVPKVTCEVRHFRGSDATMLSSPEGSETFRQAKLRVWSKHGVASGAEETLRAFEGMKRSLQQLSRAWSETNGSRHHLELDVARLEADKVLLIGQVGERQQQLSTLDRTLAELHAAVAALTRELDLARAESGSLYSQLGSLTETLAARHADSSSLRVEILRLNRILEMIYQSKTWKLHEIAERARGLVK
ncbi:MAG TPA: PIG-L family deacetylase [Thermoanaerobaculia bacterium]|nr:PIG-L family deacetylase [Thermoanaerobaculia bacterium]